MTATEDKAFADFQNAVEIVRSNYYRFSYKRRVVEIHELLTQCLNAAYADAPGARQYGLATAATSAAAMAADLNAGSTPFENVLENVVYMYGYTISGGYGRSILGGSDQERAFRLIGCLTPLASAHYCESEDGTEQSREWAEEEATYVLMLLLNWWALVLDEEGD